MKRILPCLLAVAALNGHVCAATFNVTRTDDPTPNGCAQSDCSLREAVIDANQTVQADVIMLPAGTYLVVARGGLHNNGVEVGARQPCTPPARSVSQPGRLRALLDSGQHGVPAVDVRA